jgi:hypothetical protein
MDKSYGGVRWSCFGSLELCIWHLMCDFERIERIDRTVSVWLGQEYESLRLHELRIYRPLPHGPLN